MGDIRILIDIGNSEEILVALLKIFKSTPYWIVDGNACLNNSNWATCPNKIARYFSIDFEGMRFAWATTDGDDTARGRFQVVETVEDAISIAEFAITNAETFKCDPEKPFVPAHPTNYIPSAKTFHDFDGNELYVNIEKVKEYVDSITGFSEKSVFYNYYKKLETFDKSSDELKPMLISPKPNPNFFKSTILEDMYQDTISKLYSDKSVYYNDYKLSYPKKQ